MSSTPTPIWGSALDEMLAPLPGTTACGPWLRYDPQVTLIQRAREADDPSLPMGEWERPLKQADWQEVETLCIHFLEQRSKDLQIACWLLEAALHRYEIPGLRAGIELLHGLLERYWKNLHPVIEAGDSDARVASLVWLNETLPRSLRLSVTLLPLPGRHPARLTQEGWEAQSKSDPGDTPAQDDRDKLPSCARLLMLAGEPANLTRLHELHEALELSARAWKALDRLVTDKLGKDAPSLGKVSDALAQLIHSCTRLIDGRTPDEGSAVAPGESPPKYASMTPADVAQLPFASHLSSTTSTENALRSREAAYQALEQIARYLQTVEPHSPTPYLIRRAVKWGKMPLPELMQEVLREEGDLNRLFTVLGLVSGAE